MAITTKDSTTLQNEAAAQIQGQASALVDMSVGSILRALLQAVVAVVMWLQGLLLALQASSRASSSTGADLDSWMADFQFYRLPATYATGTATFGRLTATAPAFITPTATVDDAGVPSGTAVCQSQDGTQTYGLLTDTTNTYWNAGLGQYELPANTASAQLPIVCLSSGAQGNAAPGIINTLASSLPGIDTVSNQQISNGFDIEDDTAFRNRFQLYIAALSKATFAAISSAIHGVQDGLTAQIVENIKYADDTAQPGSFYVVFDDGSGAPSDALIAKVAAAAESERALGIVFQGAYGPTRTFVDITLEITVLEGYIAETVVGLVEAALSAYVSSLGQGKGLPYSRIPQVAYDASPGVDNVTSVTVNSGTADLPALAKVRYMPRTMTVAPL